MKIISDFTNKLLEKPKKKIGKVFGTSFVFAIILFLAAIIISMLKKGDKENHSETEDLLKRIQDKSKEIKIKKEKIKKEKEKIKDSVDKIKDRHEKRKEKAKKYIKDI